MGVRKKISNGHISVNFHLPEKWLVYSCSARRDEQNGISKSKIWEECIFAICSKKKTNSINLKLTQIGKIGLNSWNFLSFLRQDLWTEGIHFCFGMSFYMYNNNIAVQIQSKYMLLFTNIKAVWFKTPKQIQFIIICPIFLTLFTLLCNFLFHCTKGNLFLTVFITIVCMNWRW